MGEKNYATKPAFSPGLNKDDALLLTHPSEILWHYLQPWGNVHVSKHKQKQVDDASCTNIIHVNY